MACEQVLFSGKTLEKKRLAPSSQMSNSALWNVSNNSEGEDEFVRAQQACLGYDTDAVFIV